MATQGSASADLDAAGEWWRDGVEPWLPIPTDAATRNVERQRASDRSVLAHYRRLLTRRRGSAALRGGALELVDVGDPDVLAYWRRAGDETTMVVRFGLQGGEIELPPGRWTVALSSDDRAASTVGPRVALGPLEAVILEDVLDTIG
jgi:glycosidase